MHTIGQTAAHPARTAADSNHPALDAQSQVFLLKLVLDQVDYGLAVIDLDSRRIAFANALARHCLEPDPDAPGGVHLQHGQLHVGNADDVPQFDQALARARNGLRALLRLDTAGKQQTLALVPLSASWSAGADDSADPTGVPVSSTTLALLVFAKQQLCDGSTMTLFAQQLGLTSMEGQVLASVCEGLRPNQIAHQRGVQISTVRTQLRSIRQKTQTDTIRELVQQISVLPPMARQFHAHPLEA